jgi:drug/metabolite transporter (DMT)-like permease
VHERIGFVYIIVSAVSFGSLAIFFRLAYAAGADPTTTLFVRCTIASFFCLAVLRARGRSMPRGKVLIALIGLGAGAYAVQSLSFFTALTLASASLVALVLYCYPAIVTTLAIVMFRERPRTLTIVALAVALIGAVLTVGPAGGGQLAGVALGLVSATMYSIYIVAGSRVIPHAGPFTSTAVIITSAAVVYAAVVAVRGPHFPTTPLGWGAVLAIAVVSTIVAIPTFLAGLERVGPSNAATLSTLEPAVTIALAALVLGETIGPLQFVGGALILAAVITLARQKANVTPPMLATKR